MYLLLLSAVSLSVFADENDPDWSPRFDEYPGYDVADDESGTADDEKPNLKDDDSLVPSDDSQDSLPGGLNDEIVEGKTENVGQEYESPSEDIDQEAKAADVSQNIGQEVKENPSDNSNLAQNAADPVHSEGQFPDQSSFDDNDKPEALHPAAAFDELTGLGEPKPLLESEDNADDKFHQTHGTNVGGDSGKPHNAHDLSPNSDHAAEGSGDTLITTSPSTPKLSGESSRLSAIQPNSDEGSGSSRHEGYQSFDVVDAQEKNENSVDEVTHEDDKKESPKNLTQPAARIPVPVITVPGFQDNKLGPFPSPESVFNSSTPIGFGNSNFTFTPQSNSTTVLPAANLAALLGGNTDDKDKGSSSSSVSIYTSLTCFETKHLLVSDSMLLFIILCSHIYINFLMYS